MTNAYKLYLSDSNTSDPNDYDIIVEPNSVVISHGLTFTGKRRIDYGVHRNTNLLRMLENFASEESSGAPPTDVIDTPLTGQLWYNKTSGSLQLYDGAAWVDVSQEGESGANVSFDNTGTNLSATTLQSAVVELDSRVGSLNYSQEYYVNDGESVTTSINSLDIALRSVSNSLGDLEDDLNAITPINAYGSASSTGFINTGLSNSPISASGISNLTFNSQSNSIHINARNNRLEFRLVDANINHDNLNGFVANEHINHASINVTGGNGLTGSGNLTGNVIINMGLPGTLTTGTSNNVTSSSHTHQVNFPVTSVNGDTGAVSIPVGTTFDELGTYAWLFIDNSGIVEGNTYSGSSLYPGGHAIGGTTPIDGSASDRIFSYRGGTSVTGSWRAMCRANPAFGELGDGINERWGLFLKIAD